MYTRCDKGCSHLRKQLLFFFIQEISQKDLKENVMFIIHRYSSIKLNCIVQSTLLHPHWLKFLSEVC